MTIALAVLCDTCDAVFVPDGNYRGAITRLAHAAGWASTNTSGTWTNQCPDHNTTKE
ncbi:hypothetical protein [Microbacterium sp. CGR1]|uniref:hypothetical protein n=1 Tax=Microbacterium sp. CGR1 TaxID=1696072 RepID=UPI000A731096|nr:hypothetical protein [Microbacterium sp. CGR1]